MRRHFVLITTLTLLLTFLSFATLILQASATSQLYENGEAPWWNDLWNYRVSFRIHSGDYDRIDVPIEVQVNFTYLLNQQGVSGTFDENSTRVIEYQPLSTLLEIPSQFEKASNFDPILNATGSVIWIMNGITQANTSRTYYVYFDILENGSKSSPVYSGSSYRITEDHVFLENEKINLTIRYKNGFYMEELYLDKNQNGIFESDEEMISKVKPYSLAVQVSETERTRHGWTNSYFETRYDDEATVMVMKDGPVLTEIMFSNISLKNQQKESPNITIEQIYSIYKLGATVDIRTVMNVRENLDVFVSYEYKGLYHQDLYDRWYVDEAYNGNFTFDTPRYFWWFTGSPTYGFLSCYNSLGNGGVAFIPNMRYYSQAWLGEYENEGPNVWLMITAGTWGVGKKIELENRLFVHVGDWAKAALETLNINNPPTPVHKLWVHAIDYDGVDLAGIEISLYEPIHSRVYVGSTNSSGWATFDNISRGDYVVRAFWRGSQVANGTVSIFSDATIDPLRCAIFDLKVYAFSKEGSAKEGVLVGLYLFDGTRISSSETDLTGSASFQSLPGEHYVIKTFYGGQPFGAAKSIYLDASTELTIYEGPGLGPPSTPPYVIVYGAVVAGIGLIATIVIFKEGYEKIKLGLFLSILLLLPFLVGGYIQNSRFSSNSVKGINATYDNETGFATIGDIVRIRWKDLDGNGTLDDSNLYILSSDDTELMKIDLGVSLVTPAGTYSLYDADTKNVYYLNIDKNDYELYKPEVAQPNIVDNIHYRYNLKLKYLFSKTGKWNVNLFAFLEQGKPSVQLRWEIVERGDGAGNYSLYPQIIPTLALDRAVLPASYVGDKLLYWNQLNGPKRGNPWQTETNRQVLSGYVSDMLVNNGSVFLHLGTNYKVQTNVYASALFSRSSNWVHNITASPPHFQYTFWVDWDGEVAPTSDIKIEVWVPDIIDLEQSSIEYSPDGSTWYTHYRWILSEGNRGDPGFSSYRGSKHRLLITLPASDFTADDGVDTGSDYGDPSLPLRRINDEYLVRLKVAYKNNGLTTYEFENSYNKWYGLRNMNDAWIWLMNSKQQINDIGIVLTKRLEYLTFQADDQEAYHAVNIEMSDSLVNGSKASFQMNIVSFSSNKAARQDLNSDGVWNMFDYNLTYIFPYSALFASRESLGMVNYETHGFKESHDSYYWVISKKPLMNDWNVFPAYTVCLPIDVKQHLEADNAVFRLERNGYYVYDVSQSNEIQWIEGMSNAQPNYQIFAVIGLAVIGSILIIKCRNVLKKHWLILALFSVGLGIRFYFQSLSVDFIGSDASVYGNVAQNLIHYGKFQVNFLGMEPHYIRAGIWPSPTITRSFLAADRVIYPSLIAFTSLLFGESFFAIKSVDVIIGSLTVIPTFYLAKKLFDQKTAIIAALIVILSPSLIYYSGVHPSTNIIPALFATTAICILFNRSNKATIATGCLIALLFFARFDHGMILAATILSYYVIFFKRDFWKEKSLYIFLAMSLSAFCLVYLWSGGRIFSTRLLGGGLGEVKAPTLLETLTNPDFIQVRLYRALYEWWYLLYEENPLIFIFAILGLLINVKNWRRLSPLYLFPFYAVSFISLSVRRTPHLRFLIQYFPILAIMSAAFIIGISSTLLIKQLRPPRRRERRILRFKNILLVVVFFEIVFLSFFSRYILIHTVTQNMAWHFNNGNIYNWIGVNTAPNNVLMASSPLYTYYTEREAVRIPFPIGYATPDLDMIISIIKRYNVDYLVLDYTVVRVPPLRSIIEDPLNAPSGFRLIYWAEDPSAPLNRRLLIYDVRAFQT